MRNRRGRIPGNFRRYSPARKAVPIFSFLAGALLLISHVSAQSLTQDHRDRHERSLALQKEGKWQEALAVVDELVSEFPSSPPSQPFLVFT
ncbi:MAG: hypothetical protein AAF491_02115, partial [Verrucomicrobiota bacterium]